MIMTITNLAKEKLIALYNEDQNHLDGIRLKVIGGGCSGLSYKIEFSLQSPKDNIIELDGIKLFIDPKSVIYLKDSILDYGEGLNAKGFIFNNPQAKNTCGCGDSFSI